jgi:hypothetical protein
MLAGSYYADSTLSVILALCVGENIIAGTKQNTIMRPEQANR